MRNDSYVQKDELNVIPIESQSRDDGTAVAEHSGFRKVQSVLVPHTMDIVKKTNMLLQMSTKDSRHNDDLNGVMLD